MVTLVTMHPARLGPYEIHSRLGQGGMGEVFEATDTATGQRVAVKTLASHLGGNPALRQRFASEINALKALRHPGIVELLAFGEDDGRPFFAMELVVGRSLEQTLRDGRRYSWRETVALALEVARALKFAHDHGVVHRDLKPANLLLLDTPRDGISVKLADFGIARLFGDTGQTSAGTVVGTAEYMAPEQATGAPVDHRADLYATGLVMFAMLAGRPPFTDANAATILARQRSEPAPRVSARVGGVPAALDDLIDRLLAKNPAHRPANALLLQRILTAIDALHGAAEPNPPTAAPAVLALLGPTLDMPAVAPADAPLLTAVGQTRTGLATPAQQPTREDARSENGPEAATPGRTRFTTVAELDARLAAAAVRDATITRQRQASGVLAATAVLGLALLLAARPPSAADLDRRIRAIEADETADLRDAWPLIDEFLDRYPDDPRAGRIAGLGHRLDVDALERRARRRPPPGRVLEAVERDYRAAMERAAESPAACLAALEAISAVRGPAGNPHASPGEAEESLWLALIRRQIERFTPLAERERAEDAARAKATLAEAAGLTRQAAAETDGGRRADLLARRRGLLTGVVEVFAGRPHAEDSVAEARRLLAAGEPAESAALTPPIPPGPDQP